MTIPCYVCLNVSIMLDWCVCFCLRLCYSTLKVDYISVSLSLRLSVSVSLCLCLSVSLPLLPYRIEMVGQVTVPSWQGSLHLIPVVTILVIFTKTSHLPLPRYPLYPRQGGTTIPRDSSTFPRSPTTITKGRSPSLTPPPRLPLTNVPPSRPHVSVK